jgi:hypothetical protein
MKQTHSDTLWFCSFRYCFGRMSYIVSDFEEAFLANFDEVPDRTKKLVLRELQYAFKKDEEERELNPDVGFYTLGQGCDRMSWKNVLNKLEEWEDYVNRPV